MRTLRLAFGALAVIALSAQFAAADTVLVRTSTPTIASEKTGYGVLGWETITGMLDAATGKPRVDEYTAARQISSGAPIGRIAITVGRAGKRVFDRKKRPANGSRFDQFA